MDLSVLFTLFVLNIGLAVVLGAFLGWSRFLDRDDDRLPSTTKEVIAALVFGLMAVVGTYSYSSSGVLYNSRNGAVIAGGLYFGPIAALGSALIAVLYRSSWGGVTMLPCLAATVIAAFLLIFIHAKCNGRISPLKAMAITIPIEAMHLIMVGLFSSNGQGWDLVTGSEVGLLMLMSTLVVGAFGLAYTRARPS